MYSTPVKGAQGVDSLNRSLSESEDGLMTPVKPQYAQFGVTRKATPSKPSGSANYRCFLDIATSGWKEDQSSELATMLMTQISAGRDINGVRRSTGQTALFSVVKQAPPFVVQGFLNHGADSSVVDLYGRSVLHYAVQNPNYKVTRLIWRQLASGEHFSLLTEADGKGLTPLHVAFSSGNLDLIGYILLYAYMGTLEKNQSPIQNPNKTLKPLSSLVDSHQRNLLHFLLESNWRNDQIEGVIVIIEKLIALGVDRFAKDDRHRTPLKVLLQTSQFHFFPSYSKPISPSSSEVDQNIQEQHTIPEKIYSPVDVASALLQGLSAQKVDLSIMLMFKNDIQGWKDDWRPIQQVMQVGEFFPFLPIFVSRCSIEALVYVDTKRRSLWHYLANMGAQKNVVEYYASQFSSSDVSSPSSSSPASVVDSETGIVVPTLEPYIIHIRSLVMATFKALLGREDAGALVSQDLVFDAEHQSPLHTAAKWNNVVALSEVFHAYGPDSQHWKDANGATPLHVSVQFNTIFVLLEIHKLGWQLNVEDSQGRTPYALAIEQKRKICARLLKAWGANTGSLSNDSSSSSTVFTPRESLEDSNVLEVEPVFPAGEAAGSRLSASLGALPLFFDPPILSPPTDRFSTISEDAELDDDDDEPISSISDSIRANSHSISTASLRSALNAAKVRDEDATEAMNLLKAEIEQLKLELASKQGESKELESALNERPTIREYEEIKEKSDKAQRINMSLKETVDELRQKVVDLELALADRTSVSNSDLTSLNASNNSKISELEAFIQQLTTQLQETKRSLSSAQIELERSQADSDILPQLRRQLDQTQGQLAVAMQEKLEISESLRENEILVKKLHAEVESMNLTLSEQANSDSPIVEETARLLESKEREMEELRQDALSQRLKMTDDEKELKNTIELLKSQLNELMLEKVQNETSLKESRLSLNELEARCAEQSQEITQLIGERDVNQAKSDLNLKADKAEMLSNFDLERQSLSDRIYEAELREESLRSESTLLKSQLESHIRERETQAKSLELLEAATTMLRTNEDNMRSIMEGIEAQVAETRRERDELMAANKILISEHNQLLFDSQRSAGENAATLTHLNEELKIARKEQAESAIQKSELVSSHQSALLALERQIGEQNAAYDLLKEQLKEAKSECERLRNTSNSVPTPELNVQQLVPSSSSTSDSSIASIMKDHLQEVKQEMQNLTRTVLSDSHEVLSASEHKIGEVSASLAHYTKMLDETTRELEIVEKSRETLLARQLELEREVAEYKTKSSHWKTKAEAYKLEKEQQLSIQSSTSSSPSDTFRIELERELAEKNGIIGLLTEQLQNSRQEVDEIKREFNFRWDGAILKTESAIVEMKEIMTNEQHIGSELKKEMSKQSEQIANHIVATQDAIVAIQSNNKISSSQFEQFNDSLISQEPKQAILDELKSLRSIFPFLVIILVLSFVSAILSFLMLPSPDKPTIYLT